MGLENVRITEKEFSQSRSNQEVMFRRQRFSESLGYSITFFYSKQSIAKSNWKCKDENEITLRGVLSVFQQNIQVNKDKYV